jgi:hypothetical protein
MPIMFNTLLREAGFPLCDVRLVRHADPRAETSPCEMWLHDRDAFNEYQSGQDPRYRSTFNAPYWAVFLATPDGTLFVGVYGVRFLGKQGRGAGAYDAYELTLKTGPAALGDLIGRLFIDWSKGGEKAWKQYAHLHDKPITELRTERVDG